MPGQVLVPSVPHKPEGDPKPEVLSLHGVVLPKSQHHEKDAVKTNSKKYIQECVNSMVTFRTTYQGVRGTIPVRARQTMKCFSVFSIHTKTEKTVHDALSARVRIRCPQ